MGALSNQHIAKSFYEVLVLLTAKLLMVNPFLSTVRSSLPFATSIGSITDSLTDLLKVEGYINILPALGNLHGIYNGQPH